ncbi:MAG: LysR family transcriptional regulator [Solirubrobacterales bacterium]|nr:LysR family transcriptional regulator [Solirubrobacterales bacterium]
MELRHLRAFIAVAEELHFGRAAARLQISQSPLSQSIRSLEAELGVGLLERTTRRVTLLPAGEAFLPRAREALAAATQAVEDARATAAGELGHLDVGFTGSMTYLLLPLLAKALRARLPRLRLQLHGEMLTPDQVEGLLSGRLDLGLLRPPLNHPGLQLEPIGSEPLVAVLPANHPLARQDRIPVSRLKDEPFITYPSHFRSVVHDAVAATCAEHGFSPTVATEVGETSTLVSFVAADAGVALVPASAQLMRIGGAVYRQLLGATHSVQIAIAWRRSDERRLLTNVRHIITDELTTLRGGKSHYTTPELDLRQIIF